MLHVYLPFTYPIFTYPTPHTPTADLTPAFLVPPGLLSDFDSVMVEGGARVLQSFLSHSGGIVDEVLVTVAPCMVRLHASRMGA